MGYIIARIIAAVLLLAALAKLPYGYYTLLRFAVCSTAGFGVYYSMEKSKIGWAWLSKNG